MRNNNNKQRNGSDRNQGSRDFRSEGNRFRGNSNRDFRSNNFNNGPRKMHKAICSECKKECEVPFKPTGNKPVYCKECFEKHKSKRF
ncbi:MAG: CxxC-x17-CxxC domain-containing protein [Nanobdellota archaeon]